MSYYNYIGTFEIIFFFRKSLQFFRGYDYDITEEFSEIEEKHESKKVFQGTKKVPMIKSILSLSFLKPFSCVGVLFITAEFSGYQAFMSYMFRVLKDSGFTLDLGLGPIIVGCIRLFVAGSENLARAVVSQINQVYYYNNK